MLNCGRCPLEFPDKTVREEHRRTEHQLECDTESTNFCVFCGEKEITVFQQYDHLDEKHPSEWKKMQEKWTKVSGCEMDFLDELYSLALSAYLVTETRLTQEEVHLEIEKVWGPLGKMEVPAEFKEDASSDDSNGDDTASSGIRVDTHSHTSSATSTKEVKEEPIDDQPHLSHSSTVSPANEPSSSNSHSQEAIEQPSTSVAQPRDESEVTVPVADDPSTEVTRQPPYQAVITQTGKVADVPTRKRLSPNPAATPRQWVVTKDGASKKLRVETTPSPRDHLIVPGVKTQRVSHHQVAPQTVAAHPHHPQHLQQHSHRATAHLSASSLHHQVNITPLQLSPMPSVPVLVPVELVSFSDDGLTAFVNIEPQQPCNTQYVFMHETMVQSTSGYSNNAVNGQPKREEHQQQYQAMTGPSTSDFDAGMDPRLSNLFYSSQPSTSTQEFQQSPTIVLSSGPSSLSSPLQATQPVQLTDAELFQLYSSDPGFKALYDAAMNPSSSHSAKPCSSASISWGFAPITSSSVFVKPPPNRPSAHMHPQSSSSPMAAAMTEGAPPASLESTVASVAAVGPPTNITWQTRGSRARDPDIAYWNGQTTSGKCPRCDYVHYGANTTFRKHYQQCHYDIYYEKTQKNQLDVERFKSMSLGPDTPELRVCLHCTHTPMYFRGREVLLQHHTETHQAECSTFWTTLQRLQQELDQQQGRQPAVRAH